MNVPLNMTKTAMRLSGFTSVFLVFLVACTPVQQLAKPQPLLIQNVNVIDVKTGSINKKVTVYIEDGLIKSITSAPIKHSSAIIINGNAHYIVPGLIDMHVHAYTKQAFKLSLSHGVTHVRIMNGVPKHLEWRDQINKDQWLASDLSVSSPIISAAKGRPLSWYAGTPEQARQHVKAAKKLGYDLIKAYGYLAPDTLNALLKEARVQNIPVAKHGPNPEGLEWQALSGLQSLEHAEDVLQMTLHHKRDLTELTLACETLAELGVPITPTLNVFWQLTRLSTDKYAFLKRLPADYISPIVAHHEKNNQVARWLNSSKEMATHNQTTLAFLQQVVLKLQQTGNQLLVGSDAGVILSPHGLATLNEMNLMHQSGLSALEVLQAATVNAASALKLEQQIGQVKPGFKANLLLLADNPLEQLNTLNSPQAVIKAGHFLDHTALKTLRTNTLQESQWWDEAWILIKDYL